MWACSQSLLLCCTIITACTGHVSSARSCWQPGCLVVTSNVCGDSYKCEWSSCSRQAFSPVSGSGRKCLGCLEKQLKQRTSNRASNLCFAAVADNRHLAPCTLCFAAVARSRWHLAQPNQFNGQTTQTCVWSDNHPRLQRQPSSKLFVHTLQHSGCRVTVTPI